MSVGENFGSKALSARLVGLGISGAMAVAVLGCVPSLALAEEVEEGSVVAPVSQVVVVDGEDAPTDDPVIESATPEAAENDSGGTSPSTSDGAISGGTAISNSVVSDVVPADGSVSEHENTTEPEKDVVVPQVTDVNQDEATPQANDSKDSPDVGVLAQSEAEAAKPNTAASSNKAAETVASKAEDAESEEASSETTVFNDTTVSVTVAAPPTVTYQNMYRLYNPNSGEHFYTSNLDEAKNCISVGWRYENIGWVAPSTGAAVYRLYNPNAGDHHYTISTVERDTLRSLGWNYEGIGWYSDSSSDALSIYRQYNPNATTGTHNFTKSTAEKAAVLKAGWNDEGIGWYASNHATVSLGQGFWIVTSAWGSFERYWIDANGVLAYNRRIDSTQNSADTGAGYAAYATTNYSGAVVRGAWANSSGYVYVADNDGKLVEYKDGAFHSLNLNRGVGTQRYYFDTSGSGKVGLFTYNGKQYYAVPGEGYILKNQSSYEIDGSFYDIDANGVVAKITITDAIKAALRYANASSQSHGMFRDLFITVSHATHTLYAWQGSAGNLRYLWSTSCTLGKPSTPSIYAYNYLSDPLLTFSGAQYAVKYYGQDAGGDGWHIHSVLNSNSELGRDISNGCIRIPVEKAKWIYDKVKYENYSGMNIDVYKS